jgi:hypothetical protein
MWLNDLAMKILSLRGFVESSSFHYYTRKSRNGRQESNLKETHQTFIIEAERSSQYIFCLMFEYFSNLVVLLK